MRPNIMATLNEADTITRELWGLLNHEESWWEPVYDEVRAGPAPVGIGPSPATPPRSVLISYFHALGQAMVSLSAAMEGEGPAGKTTYHIAAQSRARIGSTLAGPYNIGAQVFNPMWLLEALSFWVAQANRISDEQFLALLRQVGYDPVPHWLREHRDDPELVLCAMLDRVGEQMREYAARRGFVAVRGKPAGIMQGRAEAQGAEHVEEHPPKGFGAAGSLDMSTDPPTPDGLPDWAKPSGEQQVRRQTGETVEPSDD
jgi:hypothetical protein